MSKLKLYNTIFFSIFRSSEQKSNTTSPNNNNNTTTKKRSNTSGLTGSQGTTGNTANVLNREDAGWKEVVRKSKKVIVPANAISRVIGRGGCNINAIREMSGAHIEEKKLHDKILVFESILSQFQVNLCQFMSI